jgi:C-terminal processing protease CtpA/Prc
MVRVGSVEPGSAAARAGLCTDAPIWEVNNVDVTNASHAEVVELIRKHPTRVRLLVPLS